MTPPKTREAVKDLFPHEEAALKYADKSYDRRTTAYANCFLDFRAGVDWALKYQAAITREETIAEVLGLLRSETRVRVDESAGTISYEYPEFVIDRKRIADWLEEMMREGKQ